MCLNPIYLPNRVKSRYGGLPFIKVPCRNCPECAASAQRDLLVRVISLWNSLPVYYYCYFCTLTFRNDDLPRTNIYKPYEYGYKLIKEDVPCFDHTIYKRFRKNFTEFITDTFKVRPYILSTCEYGDKKHRPHYHCIIFVPYYNNWRLFKKDLERFWHYGFTKNTCITVCDGKLYERSVFNAFKYVTKYACKYSTWQPFYLKGDFVTDYPPSDIKPRVFTSNGFGAQLEKILTYDNYKTNTIYLSIKGDKQFHGDTFSIPSYYRRRKFVTTEIISNDVVKDYYLKQCFNSLNSATCVVPYIKKMFNRPKVYRKSVTYRSDDYCNFLYNDFCSSLRQKLFHYDEALKKNPDLRGALRIELEKGGIYDLNIDYKSLYHKMQTIYLERREFPLSPFLSRPLPYINKVENVSKRIYKMPCNYDTFSYKRIVDKELELAKRKELPFGPNLQYIRYKTQVSVSYCELPTDYYKLCFVDDYLRRYKYKQYKRKEKNEIEWLKQHVIPYNDMLERARV